MQVSGKLVIVGIFGAAIAGAVLTWWFQFDARRRSRDFWGNENAVLIGRAPKVELLRLRKNDETESAGEQLEIDGDVFDLVERKDISKARGLVHVRDALIRDNGFQWDRSRGDCPPQWEHAFRFVDENKDLTVAVDVRCQRVRLLPNGQEADIGPMYQGIKELIDRESGGTSRAIDAECPSGLASDPPFHRLLMRIRSRYAIHRTTVEIGGRDYDFTRVLDPDRVLEEHQESGGETAETQEPWQPYWAAAWESAMVLAEELTRRRSVGQNVLDLGCGLGLVGTVAAALGQKVFMADAAPPALLFARLNSWPWRENVRVKQFNWRHDQLAQSFSLIAGSDIVYDRDEWPYLDRFWRRHLTADGTVLLAEPGRSTGSEFIPWIRQRDWRLRQLSQTAGEGTSIRILELQPN